jgi:hypothetical protein
LVAWSPTRSRLRTMLTWQIPEGMAAGSPVISTSRFWMMARSRVDFASARISGNEYRGLEACSSRHFRPGPCGGRMDGRPVALQDITSAMLVTITIRSTQRCVVHRHQLPGSMYTEDRR